MIRALVFAATLVLATPALAQPGPAEDYGATIDDALVEFQAGRWPEARALFHQAHDLQPSARTHRGIGLCSFEMRDYVDALRHLTSALSDTRRPLTPELRLQVEDLVGQAHGFVGRYALAIRSVGAEVAIEVDGRPFRIDKDTIDDELVLEIGVHELVFSAAGHDAHTRSLEVRGGEREGMEVLLEPVASAPVSVQQDTALPIPRPVSETPRERPSIPAGVWVVSGAGLATLLVSAGTGVGAASAASELEDGCPTGELCSPLLADTRDEARTLAITTDVLLGVGGGTLVGGIVWLVLDRVNAGRTDDEEEPSTEAQLLLSPGFAGMSVSTRY